ncbi:response regulator transcription factor [uncultured Duncaniella sp.]|uniref:response regulator transcription factor n=1 Tax=uncultured Duncaniella sp. TaxID=2768039 RepID=UPI00263AD44C|nr:response regulator transcription factor [uncultured Duncaniella sp.]
MPVKILVIDDEEALCEILKFNLEKDGYDVTTAYSAEEALTLDLSSFSLMIVDIMMERLSGFDFAKRVRVNAATEFTPIIFCSALSGEDDTVMGLNIGADDYITKPFVISEVLARVRAVLRRSQPKSPWGSLRPSNSVYEPDVVFENLRIDQNEKLCYLNNEPANLTKTELDILLFLLQHRNRIYSREEIIRHVWSSDVVVTNRTIDTNIARLRKKIGQYGNNIVTRLGFGYGFQETV